MNQRRDEHPDELLSASLTGDLTGGERIALDEHLASCARCRETLDGFASTRRLMAGLRHEDPPRDLRARVDAGIQGGTGQPWWRRASTLVGVGASALTVAAAAMLVVVLGDLPSSNPFGQATPTASVSAVASAGPSDQVSLSPAPTPVETAVVPSIDPNPVGRLEFRIEDQVPKLHINTHQATRPVGIARYGLPLNAALSPDGEWVAFQVIGEQSDLVDTYAYQIDEDRIVTLNQGGLDSPFSRLAWSEDGRLLAFTAIDVDRSSDAWIFSTDAPDDGARQLTADGNAFAASFVGASGDNDWLWVSTAAEEPTTYRLAVPRDGTVGEPVDLADAADGVDAGSFLPMRSASADAPAAAVWRGQMALDASGWHFVRGGMLYMAYADTNDDFDLAGADQQVFDTLVPAPGGAAFRSARFAWAPDGDGFAVWSAEWEGTQQPEGFPDPNRIYFGHVMTDVFIGPLQALDLADTDGGRVVNVALAGGQYLAVTIQTAEGSEGGSYAATAELRLITRHLGSTPDEVETIGSDRTWIGPAFYPATLTD
jgi:hypothetical protein